MTDPAERFREGWRLGRQAAAAILAEQERAELHAAGQALLRTTRERVEGLPPPPPEVALPRAERLEAAIRASTALLRPGHADEALAVLEDALR